jgi:two-component system LytT family sensor kinase
MSFSMHANADRNWLFRYKLYHIPLWFVYHYLWWVVAMGNPYKAASSLVFFPMTIKFSFYVIFQALAVYFNLYYLIPKYLAKSRFSAYLAYLLLTISATTLLIVGGYYVSSYASGMSMREIYGGGTDAECFFRFLNNALPSTVASMTLAMSIKLTKTWIQTEHRQRLLENEKLETELKFLKNQFNPHFLFNTINSIFFLIHKNPDLASDALAKFSELLRYQLYECNEGQIPLSNEIVYMQNFVELEKLRQSSNISVDFEMHHPPAEMLGIAPFVLMVFVENAFKHVSRHTREENSIAIRVGLEGRRLDFRVSNTTSVFEARDVVHYGGIGLKNVQRRLDLIYPDQYVLDIQRDEGYFEVNLRLNLSEFTVPEPV